MKIRRDLASSRELIIGRRYADDGVGFIVQCDLLSDDFRVGAVTPPPQLMAKDLKWYNWVRRAQLKSYREEFHASYRQLTSFIDDATALLLCEGTHSQASGFKTAMFAEAYKRRVGNCSIEGTGHGDGAPARQRTVNDYIYTVSSTAAPTLP